MNENTVTTIITIAVLIGVVFGLVYHYQQVTTWETKYDELQLLHNQTVADARQFEGVGCMYINFSVANYQLLGDASELFFNDIRTAMIYDDLSRGAQQDYNKYCRG